MSGWAGLNYETPEVREFMMSHIREYLEIMTSKEWS